MKKFFTRFLVCSLAVLMLFVSVSCKGNGDDTSGKENHKVYYEGGTHVYNVGTTDKQILVNGNTDYKIVVPEEQDDYIKNASLDMKDILFESTGTTFPIITDEGLTYSEDAKYISLGNTTIFEGTDIAIEFDELEGDGFKIVTKGSNVIINGITSKAVYFGAFELLHQLINYEFFSIDCETYDTGVSNIALPDFDITDVGDFVYRVIGTAPSRGDFTTRNRLRMHWDNETMMLVNGIGFHNSTEMTFPDRGYFPYNEYHETHPEIFSQDFKELCYTAHGNEESYKMMQEVAIERMKTAILEQPEKNIITFTQSDYTSSNCTCQWCQEAKAKYGAYSGAYLVFINSVAKEVNKWIAENNIRKIYIATAAYVWSFEPPSISPVPEELQLEDNFTIFIAPIQADYFVSFTDTKNSGFADVITKWSNLVDNMMFWIYSTHFTDFFTPFPNFDGMQETYSFLRDKGAFHMFEEGQAVCYQSGFTQLKVYLQSKLMWDINADYEATIDNFFTNYFGLAEIPMRKLFDELRLWTRHRSSIGELAGNCLSNNRLWEAGTWPENILRRWMDYIDQALDAIEVLKITDIETYNAFYKRIALESLAYRYLLIRNFSSSFQPAELLEMKLSFRADCALTGVSSYYGGGSVTQLFTQWGI